MGPIVTNRRHGPGYPCRSESLQTERQVNCKRDKRDRFCRLSRVRKGAANTANLHRKWSALRNPPDAVFFATWTGVLPPTNGALAGHEIETPNRTRDVDVVHQSIRSSLQINNETQLCGN